MRKYRVSWKEFKEIIDKKLKEKNIDENTLIHLIDIMEDPDPGLLSASLDGEYGEIIITG
jgi:hypothetical protein